MFDRAFYTNRKGSHSSCLIDPISKLCMKYCELVFYRSTDAHTRTPHSFNILNNTVYNRFWNARMRWALLGCRTYDIGSFIALHVTSNSIGSIEFIELQTMHYTNKAIRIRSEREEEAQSHQSSFFVHNSIYAYNRIYMLLLGSLNNNAYV